MKLPLLAPLAAFAAGIVVAQHAAFSFRELSISILLLAALAVLGLARGATRAGAVASLTGFLFAGALLTSLPAPADPNRITSVIDREGLDRRDPARLTGWVSTPPTVRLDRDQFVLSVEAIGDKLPARGGIRISVLRRPGEPPIEVHYGDHIEFLARLHRLHNFQNPGGFDRTAFLARQDIYMTASVRAGVPIRDRKSVV